MTENTAPTHSNDESMVWLATDDDTETIRCLLRASQQSSKKAAGDLLEPAALAPNHYVDGDIFSGGARHYVLSQSAKTGVGVVGFRYIPSAPPVYDPQRGILCIEEFLFDGEFDSDQATLMLDLAVQKGLELSEAKPLLIVAVTWEHEQERNSFMRRYPGNSTLNTNEGLKHIFVGKSGYTTCSQAVDWYFGDANAVHASIPETTDYTVAAATLDEVEELVALSSNARTVLERHQPIFWRKAANGDAAQLGFFRFLVENVPNSLFTARNANNEVCGVIWSFKKQEIMFAGRGFILPNGIQVDDCTATPATERLAIIKAMVKKVIEAHRQSDGDKETFEIVVPHHDKELAALFTSLGMRSLLSWEVMPGGVC